MGRTKRRWNKKAKQLNRSRPASDVSETLPGQGQVEGCTIDIDVESSQSLEIRLAKDSVALKAQIDDYAEKVEGMVLNLKGLLERLQTLKNEVPKNKSVNCMITHSLQEVDTLENRTCNAPPNSTPRLNNLSLNLTPRFGFAPLAHQGPSILNSITFERYDGNKDFKTIHDWLYAFDAYWNIITIPEEDKVKFAALHLRGAAAIIWCKHNVRAQQGHETMISNWGQFRNWIMHNFLPHNYVDQTRTEWRNLRQKNNTVQLYVEQFENCLLRVPDTVDESEQVHHFLIGLRRDIRQEVKVTKPATLAEAVFQAEVVEEKLCSKKTTISQMNKNKEEKHSRSKKEPKEFATLDYLTLMCTPKITKKEMVEGSSVEGVDYVESIKVSKNSPDKNTTRGKEPTDSISEYDLLRMRYGILNAK
ncbi:hypothetical protein KC19_11G096600 [Ceratodon purpureus]|uniref:Retrotransposon gag domain-containing protein n=1 Tax=Ceratodon purpureus TaxID=3225 RepID=A0A8T0GDA6_CERPU|nr:hypothetical protein KC19_11G096600 [Ceratodon purpureus]